MSGILRMSIVEFLHLLEDLDELRMYRIKYGKNNLNCIQRSCNFFCKNNINKNVPPYLRKIKIKSNL